MSAETSSTVSLAIEGDQAIIALGTDGRLPILTAETLIELKTIFEQIRERPDIRSLVIHSESEKGFCAGANIDEIKGIHDASEGAALAARGQEIFDILEDLHCFSVVAIHGPCMGGGCELALAADYRVALDSERCKIGAA